MELLHARRNRSAGTFTTSLCCRKKLCATRRATLVNTSKQMLHSITEQSTYRHVAPREAVLVERLVVVSLRRPRPPSWLGRQHRRLPGHFFCRSGGPHTEAAASDVAIWMLSTVDMPEILATANLNCLNHRYLGKRYTSKEQQFFVRCASPQFLHEYWLTPPPTTLGDGATANSRIGAAMQCSPCCDHYMQRRFHSADAHGPSCNAPRGGESRFRKCLALADAALQRFAEFRNVH